MNDLEIRIRNLERTRRMFGYAVLGLALVMLVGGASKRNGDVIQAQRFELVNAAGDVLAVLGADEDGATGLFIRDPAGQKRLSLTHDKEQSALFINDAEGTVRIGVAQFAHGGGGLALHGPNSKGAAVLYYKKDGSLSFYDVEGQVTTRVPPKKP